MTPPTAIVYPSITTQNSRVPPELFGCLRLRIGTNPFFPFALPLPHLHPVFRLGYFRLAEALSRTYSEALVSGITVIGAIRLFPDLELKRWGTRVLETNPGPEVRGLLIGSG